MPPPVRNLRLDFGLQFAFRPSIGIMARDVDKLGLDIRSFREPLKRSIQQVLAPSFQKNFTVGGRPRWTPLADATVERREEAGYPGHKPILVRTGLLKRTMGQFNIWTVDTQKAALLDLPAKIWYGKIHQGGYGTPGSLYRGVTGAGIPRRPFALIQPEDNAAIERVFSKWLQERIDARWNNIRRAAGSL